MRCMRSNGIRFAAWTTGRRRTMTTISQTAGRSLRSSSSDGFFRKLASGAYALFDLLERRSAVKTLNDLDDRALRDIGITRSQIEDAVYGQAKAELARYL
ncbi:hypothetical protein C7G41_35165 [Bradyrhizobium sp. MOS002]|nr:hypothetical protein C7G41_35165 [Bradyrhizobium sp. MOS002]